MKQASIDSGEKTYVLIVWESAIFSSMAGGLDRHAPEDVR